MKYMKNCIGIWAAIVLTSVGCGGEEGIKISGKIANPIANERVIVNELTDKGFEPVDTLEVNKTGDFVFYLNPSAPTFYRINCYNRQQAAFILDGTEGEVSFQLDGSNPQGELKVTGSVHTDYLLEMQGLIQDHQQDVKELEQKGMQARMEGNEQQLQELTETFFELVRSNQEALKKYIWNITPSLAAFYGLQSLSPEENLTFFDSVATKYEAELPDHVLTKELLKQVNSLRTLAVGADAPEISLPDPDGNVITLSSLRGNYVLIDFWAAWCRPCRVENPNVVKMYEEYRGKNFEILGVSLDRTRDAWIKAIQDDGLGWKHVSDLKYFNSEAAAAYQINAIPATYLIDPDGKIIAKGLRGESLRAKLKEIFG